jgi:hypothetical protein
LKFDFSKKIKEKRKNRQFAISKGQNQLAIGNSKFYQILIDYQTPNQQILELSNLQTTLN